jgi:hypothetical protein
VSAFTTYKIEAGSLDDAVNQLLTQFRARNPMLNSVKLEFLTGEKVTITLPSKPRKLTPGQRLQRGPTVTTSERAKP